MKLAAVSIAMLLCVLSCAQDLTPGANRAANGTQPPVLLTKQEPQYTEEARIAKLQGSVRLSLVVGEDGIPRDIRVVKSLGLGLDESAVAAVSQWRFQPGTKDGKPVPRQSQLECYFRLATGTNDWSLSRAQFTVPAGATPPKLLIAPRPAPGDGVPQVVTARVGFDVSPQGTPVNIQIEDTSDPNWNDDVINLIREWRFLGALNNGTLIQSHAEFDLTRGLAPALPVQVPRKKQ
jgi:TonB family protein